MLFRNNADLCLPANFSGKMLMISFHRCCILSLSPQFLLLGLLCKALEVGKFFKSSVQNSDSNFEKECHLVETFGNDS